MGITVVNGLPSVQYLLDACILHSASLQQARSQFFASLQWALSRQKHRIKLMQRVWHVIMVARCHNRLQLTICSTLCCDSLAAGHSASPALFWGPVLCWDPPLAHPWTAPPSLPSAMSLDAHRNNTELLSMHWCIFESCRKSGGSLLGLMSDCEDASNNASLQSHWLEPNTKR